MIEPPHCSSAKWIIRIQGKGFLRVSPPTILPFSACLKELLFKNKFNSQIFEM